MIKNKTEEEKWRLSMQGLHADNICYAREFKRDSCRNEGLKTV